jgi:excisionase family DNA binding protein
MFDVVEQRIVLTPVEAAEMLGVSRPTIYRYIESGAIPSVKMNGHIFIPRAPFLRLFGFFDE